MSFDDPVSLLLFAGSGGGKSQGEVDLGWNDYDEWIDDEEWDDEK